MSPSFRILLRGGGLFPALSVFLAPVLVFTQVFTCCRLNESFSAGLSRAYAALTHREGQETQEKPAGAGKTHAGCHGHGQPAEETSPLPAPDRSGAALESHEACLSEAAFTFQALHSTPSDDLVRAPDGLSLSAPLRLTEKVRLESPRPRNKSSPPVYLLTRRLLV